MIKFFRNIRKKLVSEKPSTTRTANYLKYAIGEIVLVVFGILIALSINNWNENRKDTIKEQQILSQLAEEYETNLLQLEQKITHRNKIIQAGTKILQYIDEPINVNIDSLNSQLSIMMGSPTFKPIENNLISSGNILLIKNEKLNRLLATWPSNVLTLQGIENIWEAKMFESIVPLFIDIEILRDGLYKWWNDEQNLKWILEGKGANPFKVPKSNKTLKTSEILNNKKLEGIISLAISSNYAANLQSQIIHKRILEIMELLNQEIK